MVCVCASYDAMLSGVFDCFEVFVCACCVFTVFVCFVRGLVCDVVECVFVVFCLWLPVRFVVYVFVRVVCD